MQEPESRPSGKTAEVSVSEPAWLKGALLAHARHERVDACDWLTSQRPWLSRSLRTAGAVLLRGFAPISVDQLEAIATIAGEGPPMPYENRSTPRKTVKGNIYTSTEYPPSQSIPLHSENSYSADWPGRILFLCVQPALRGGETPITDNRRVYAAIPPATRSLFESRGVAYVRNYGDLGLSWQETFQTDRREEVEEYCRHHDIELQWRDGERLRTRQVLPAARRHPATGEPVWFNQAHLFHVSNLGKVGEELVAEFGMENLPRNALFGDGSDIDSGLLREVLAAYESQVALLAWQANDLAILDNMLWAHGRRPFTGPRRVLVAMTKMSPASVE